MNYDENTCNYIRKRAKDLYYSAIPYRHQNDGYTDEQIEAIENGSFYGIIQALEKIIIQSKPATPGGHRDYRRLDLKEAVGMIRYLADRTFNKDDVLYIEDATW